MNATEGQMSSNKIDLFKNANSLFENDDYFTPTV
jgi:hypothetical protein